MNFIRYLTATLCLFVFIFSYEMLIHDYILLNLYQTTQEVWRDFAEMEANLLLIICYQLVLSAWSVFIFCKLFREGGIRNGLRFGLCFGVLGGILTASWYLWLPVPVKLGLGWLLCGIGEGLGGGLVLGFIYNKNKSTHNTIDINFAK